MTNFGENGVLNRSARRFKIRRWRGNTIALPLGNKAVDLGRSERGWWWL